MPSVDQRMAAQAEAEARRSECVSEAIQAGLKSAASAVIIGGGVLLALQRYSPAFRDKFTTGAKATFGAMPVFFSFFYVTETTVARCHKKRATLYTNHAELERIRQQHATAQQE